MWLRGPRRQGVGLDLAPWSTTPTPRPICRTVRIVEVLGHQLQAGDKAGGLPHAHVEQRAAVANAGRGRTAGCLLHTSTATYCSGRGSSSMAFATTKCMAVVEDGGRFICTALLRLGSTARSSSSKCCGVRCGAIGL